MKVVTITYYHKVVGVEKEKWTILWRWMLTDRKMPDWITYPYRILPDTLLHLEVEVREVPSGG